MKSEIIKIYNSSNKNAIVRNLKSNGLWKFVENEITIATKNDLEKLFLYVTGEDPICRRGNKRKFINAASGYSTCGGFCECAREDLSKKKSSISEEKKKLINEKRKKTCIERFGETTNLKTDETKERIRQTCLKKYGVDHPKKSKTIQEKTRQTNIKKYGVDNPLLNDEVRERIRQTNIKKYGVDNPFKSSEIQKKAANTKEEKYGKDHLRTHLKISMHNKYGVSNPSQLHLSLESIEITADRKKFTEYVTDKTLWEISDGLGLSYDRAYKLTKKYDCSDIIKKTTNVAEEELFQFLTRLGLTVNRNRRDIIPPMEVDLYLPNQKLAIEYCGLYWHSEFKNVDKNYHAKKMHLCEDAGVKLITIFEDEFKKKKDIVLSRLAYITNQTTDKVYARNCEVRELNNKSVVRDFLEKNHLQGNCQSSIDLGLFYGGDLVSIMTFGKPRKFIQGSSDFIDFELLRFCSVLNTSVTGAANKLLKYFILKYSPKGIVSYADRRWSDGKLYDRLGFDQSPKVSIGYWYVSPNSQDRIHRFNFRKSKLVSEGYDESLTEHEIMKQRGYSRIWDCGQMKFVLEII